MENIKIHKGGACEKPEPPVDPMELVKELRAALEVASAYIPLHKDHKPGTHPVQEERISCDLEQANKAIAVSEAWLSRITPFIYGTPERAESLEQDGWTALQVTVQQTYLFPEGSTNGWDANGVIENLFRETRIRGSHAWRDGSHLGGGDVVIGIKKISDPFCEDKEK